MSCNNGTIDYGPKNIPYRKRQGDHFQIPMTLTDSAGAAIDLSDSQDIQFFVDDVEVASLGSGITVSGVDNNDITIIAADDRAVGANYVYKIVITDVDGVIRTHVEGKMKIIVVS